MTRTLNVVARAMLLVSAIAGAAFGQAASPSSSSLSFEVASIRPAPPLDPATIMSGKAHLGMSVDKERVDIGSLPLVAIIMQAYKIELYRIVGDPGWLKAANADRFDILAKMPAGATKDQVPEMLQMLLAERFKLAVHYENKDLPAYALVVGKGGPKLKEADAVVPEESAAASPGTTSGKAVPDAPKPATGEIAIGRGDNRATMKQTSDGVVIKNKGFGTMRMRQSENGGLRMEADSVTMERFASTLSQFMDLPVVDMTELPGKYKVSLEVSRDTLMNVARKAGMNVGMMTTATAGPGLPADAATDPSDGSIFASVQQLGLKLERRKLPSKLLVIDHVEKAPTEN